MSISLELPRASERVKMKQEGDWVSLYISISTIWCFIVSVLLGIVFALNFIGKWIPNEEWMPIAAGIALGLASIGILASSLTRGRFIFNREQKREASIAKKAHEVKEQFIESIIDRYARETLHKVTENERRFDRKREVHIMKVGEIFEVPKSLEIKFEDLEEVYPKNETDKEIDREVRERVFYELEFSRFLKVEKEYEAYVFVNTGEHIDLFKKYNVDHWNIMF